MNNRPLQPGDLCLIVGYKNSPDNVGMLCRLVKFVDAGLFEYRGKTSASAGSYWLVDGDRLSVFRVISGVKKNTGWCLVAANHLMRIDGDPDAESDKLKQDLPQEETV